MLSRKIVVLSAMAAFVGIGPAFSGESQGRISASCPPYFFENTDTRSKLKLESAEIWANFLALQEPNDSPKGYFSGWETTPNDSWELRCKYQSDREIVIELPRATTSCRSGRQAKSSPYQADCIGSSTQPEPTPDAVHAIPALSRSISLKGFAIGQTAEQVTSVAVGLNAKATFLDSPDGRSAEIPLGSNERIHVLFNRTGYVQEVSWDLPDDPLRTAVLIFGFFDKIGDEKQTVIWTRAPGLLVKAHWSSTEETGNSIQLLSR